MTSNIPREDRYRMKVDQRGPDECWPWLAGHNRFGYGTFRGGDGEQLAHRYGYKITVGPIPDGLLVCHHCDNPECQNPDHWFTGTPGDNSADKMMKGRWRGGDHRGEKHSQAKLTDSDIVTIVDLYKAGMTQAEIGAKFGMTQTPISKILRRSGWAHLQIASANEPNRRAIGARNPQTKLTAENVTDIRSRYAREGISQQALADEYSVSQHTISQVIRRKVHTTIRSFDS